MVLLRFTFSLFLEAEVEVPIPNAQEALIDPVKIQGYLLSVEHPIGRLKARFFAHLGYSWDNWQRLEADLRAQHLTRDAARSVSTRYGVKYEIRAMLQGPAGVAAEVVSVWIVRTGEAFPRFVTAYPGGAL